MTLLKISFAILLLFCLPLYSGNIPAKAATTRSAPEVKCQISTPAWCVTFGVSEIALTTSGAGRIWTFRDPVSMHNGPVTIIERVPNCTGGLPLDVRKISEQVNGSNMSMVYALISGTQCQLEFLVPMKNGVVEDAYTWAIKTNIQMNGQPLGIISH